MGHKDKSCGTKTIYRLSDRVPGVNDREWHATKPAGTVANSTTAIGRDFRLTHDFSLPTTTVSVNPNINLDDTNNTAQELDIQVVDTVITVPEGGVWIQYAGGSEGYWAIEVGYCCGALQLMDELGYQDREDASAIVGPVFLPEGQHMWRGWNIDTGGTNSSHNAQYSLDGTTFTAAIPAGVEFNLEKRAVECQIIPTCDPIPDGWQVEQFKDCVPVVVDPLPTPSVEVTPLSDATPIADNEIDTAIRTGLAGTSTEAARADHNHPIRRQTILADPVVTVGGGGGVLSESIVLDRGSDEESIWYRFRVLVTHTTSGNTANWAFVQIPTFAGFQQPLFSEVNGYRSQTIAPQVDDTQGNPTGGASPLGPFMGENPVHWSSTNRLYLPHFRRDNLFQVYVGFVVKYVRA